MQPSPEILPAYQRSPAYPRVNIQTAKFPTNSVKNIPQNTASNSLTIQLVTVSVVTRQYAQQRFIKLISPHAIPTTLSRHLWLLKLFTNYAVPSMQLL
jgi:hypothetical protein